MPLVVSSSRRFARAVLVSAVLAGAVTACSTDEEPAYVERPVEELYNAAMDQFEARDYKKAALAFEEVDRQHPYSVWATKSQLMTAYTQYLADKYDDAVISLDRYIELHPGSSDTPYAYYLRAICYYEQISDIQRDQKITALAQQALQEVVQRYPESTYARDARLKLDLTQDHLAGKEMAVGRFYLKRGEYLAAINRFRTVVERFQTTTHVPEALHRLVEAYLSLGVTDEAQMAAAVLGHNYPASQWYADSYALLEGRDLRPEANESWLAEMWDWVF
ncbi:outer membrane protein assembly factor BamD [Aestuariispira ectoiniformans]|uniref:outer membrane protein assembly factor BamD n=1 Tax=Aestuariispira ectoiniformans TaxID=2775080 RepID=UPI00223AD303|nr:outer membrane protein assembly factor BamD [Aestuariispira ectoiniformans]